MRASTGVLDEFFQLIRLALPIAFAQGGQALMGLVDVAVVGRVGKSALAAVGLANSVFFAVAVVGMGLMMGLDPLASQALGAGDRVRARKLLWQGVWLAVFASLALASTLLLSPLVLKSMHINVETAIVAQRCVWLRMIGLAPMLLFVSVRAYLQASGSTLPMVWAVVLANIVNLVGDLLLVFGGSSLPAWTGPLRAIPALGAEGSALSTAFSTMAQLVIVGYAVKRIGVVPLPKGARRPSKPDLWNATRVGLPVGLQNGAEVGVFALVTLLAGRLGDQAVAAHQLAIALASLSFCIAIGVGQAGSVRVGWAVGRGDQAAVRRSGLVSFAGGVTVMSISGLLFLLIPEQLARALTDQPEVVATAVPLLGVAAFFQISDGVQGVGAGVLRGAGDMRYPFVANVLGHYLVGLPVAIVLGFVLAKGITGLWWGLCAGLTAVAIALFGRFLHLSSKPIRPLESGTLHGH
jgi:MATE family multidrug resistance protein